MYTCLQCVGFFLLLEVYNIEIFQTVTCMAFLRTHSFYIHVHYLTQVKICPCSGEGEKEETSCQQGGC